MVFLVWAIFSLWFILSIGNQFSWISERILRFLPLTFILPHWQFFAPEPGNTDMRLAFRELIENNWTEWKEVDPPKRTSIRFIWNPTKFDSKALVDIAMVLFDRINCESTEILVSWPYLALLKRIHLESSWTAEEVQFAILESSGFTKEREISIRFISYCHRT